MDRYDEILNRLRAAQGHSIETIFRTKADDTIAVLVGPHSERLADIRSLAADLDCNADALAKEIAAFWPQAIATVGTWKQRHAAAQE